MKIDIFPHIIPPSYKNAIFESADTPFFAKKWDHVIASTPALYDLDLRFRAMDQYPDVLQVLTLGAPAVEEIASPDKASHLAKLANDEMAEMVEKYPDRFLAAVACLPMNDMDAALRETERAVHDLKFKGVQIFTPTDGKPLDSPEFLSLYEEMFTHDLPIWIHPSRGQDTPDYPEEKYSKYWIFQMFGWPYETTVAMTRLVFSGIFDKYPNVKFITHHCGAMVPYFAERIVSGQDYAEANLKAKYKAALKKPPIDYYRQFYADTALNGSQPGLMCGYRFFGPERILFGTDTPFDSENGSRSTRDTIKSIEEMEISRQEKEMIFVDFFR